MAGGSLRGWRLPLGITCDGTIATVTADQLVRQSIMTILGTAPGERPARPEFGCAMHELLFAPNDANTAGLAAHYALQALERWEPRIRDVEVRAAPALDRPNVLILQVRYTVSTTRSFGEVAYPFDLRRGEAR